MLVKKAAEFLNGKLGAAPRLAVVLGSGVTLVGQEEVALNYEEIPGMPAPGVAGHSGNLKIIEIENQQIAVMAGRKHLYEGATLDAVTFATRMLAKWGVKQLILTNAAGGLSQNLEVGELMLIRSTIDLLSPTKAKGILPALIEGPVPRDTGWLPEEIKGELKQGTYAAVLGPNYETSAEVSLLLHAGADAVGMSTVPELAAADQAGMDAAGLSVITNTWAKPTEFHGHEAVVKAAAEASVKLQRFLRSWLRQMMK
jgi:purine-nucleoside phosphorylase